MIVAVNKGNVATMTARNLTREVEAQPDPGNVRVGGGHDAAEAGEELVAVLGCDSEPVVGHANPGRVRVACDGADHVAPLRRILDGVVDDVAQPDHNGLRI